MTYLKVFTDFRELMEPLNAEEKGRLFEAMLLYALDGTVPALVGNERFIWPMARQQIDQEAAHYESKVEANRENGRKGAAARWSKGKDSDGHDRHSEAMANDSENAQEKEKEKEQEKEQEQEKEYEQEKEKEDLKDLSQEYVCMPKENAPARADTHTGAGRDRDLFLGTAGAYRIVSLRTDTDRGPRRCRSTGGCWPA